MCIHKALLQQAHHTPWTGSCSSAVAAIATHPWPAVPGMDEFNGDNDHAEPFTKISPCSPSDELFAFDPGDAPTSATSTEEFIVGATVEA